MKFGMIAKDDIEVMKISASGTYDQHVFHRSGS
jgi:hypothetical protein